MTELSTNKPDLVQSVYDQTLSQFAQPLDGWYFKDNRPFGDGAEQTYDPSQVDFDIDWPALDFPPSSADELAPHWGDEAVMTEG